MLKIFSCLLVVGLTAARIDIDGCGISKYRQSRIIGGTPAKPGAYPWMVLLEMVENNRVWSCGGSILNEDWIVTAAHCVDGYDAQNVVAYAGLHSKDEKEGNHIQKLNLSEIIVHPQFNDDDEDFLYDIAILKTIDPIDIEGSSGYVNGICLPKSDQSYTTGNAKVIGWGCKSNEENNVVSDILHEVVVQITKCEGERMSTQICAGGDGKNICAGDSGGPLFQQDEENVATLIGIVSSSPPETEKPSFYVKIAEFLDWMEEEMT